MTTSAGREPQNGRTWPPPVHRAPTSSPVLSPEDEMKTFFLPRGYRVELVASEPMIEEPVLIDFDLAGRLWVVEMPGYMRDMAATGERRAARTRQRARGSRTTTAAWTSKTVFLDQPDPAARAEGPRSRRADRRAAKPVVGPRHRRRSASADTQRARDRQLRPLRGQRRAQRQQLAVGPRQLDATPPRPTSTCG